jgi:dipeptidase
VRSKRTLLVLFVVLAGLTVSAAALIQSHRAADRAAAPEAAALEPEGCTVIMVGKDASTDGSTMATHTADCGVCDWTWRHVPAADHKPGSTRKIRNISQFKTWPPTEGLKWDLVNKEPSGLEIPEVPHTYAYHHGMFGYLNEKQLAIGESTIGNIRKLGNPTPVPKFNISELTLLAMERCTTAREAIQLMGSLAEKYGYGYLDGGEMLAVTDPQEVWVFEIMPVGPLWTPQSGQPGALWCAERVPDDHVSVCPNESRIGEIDLANKDFFMASPNVVSYAVENKLYDPASGKPFSWKRTYSPSDGSAVSSEGRRARMWRFFNIVAPGLAFRPEMENMDYPFSVKPEKKISVADVMTMTRDKCQGTAFDPVLGIRGGPFSNPNYWGTTRTIGTRAAEYTTITQCRASLPDPIGGIVWINFGAQDTACYMPFYAGADAMPKSFAVGDHWTFNRGSARWASDYVDYHVQVVYDQAMTEVQAALDKWEGGAVARTPEIDAKALELYKKSPAKAREFLTGYCLNNAQNVVDAWWRLGDEIWLKYKHLAVYDTAKRTYGRYALKYPDWWKRAVKAYDAYNEPLPAAAGH